MKINKRKGLRQRKAGIFTICCILFLIVGLITQKERKIIATSSGGYAGALALALSTVGGHKHSYRKNRRGDESEVTYYKHK